MSIIIGNNNPNSLNGTNSNDIILGGSANDTINGSAGADLIDGGNGNDSINGGSGNDLISGGNGNDTVNGGTGSDFLCGDNGNDTLNGGAGSDIILAGKGDDVIIHDATENNGAGDIYSGEQGRDTLRLIVTQAMYNSSAFQTELARYQSMIDKRGSASGAFETLDILFSSIENIEVVIKTPTNQAPNDISLSATSVAENSAPGTVVATLSAVDPDGPGSLTFSIVGSSNQFEIVGNQLRVKDGAVLNFEDSMAHEVTLLVTDAGGLTHQETFSIAVTNVNEAPIDISISDQSVNENASAGTLVATLGAIDPDLAQSHTFEIVGGSTNFAIVGNELRVIAGATLDHESAAEQSITIRATDSDNQSVERTFVLSIADQNDAPTAVSLTNVVAQTPENSGTFKVADIVVSDDALGLNQLSLSGDDAEFFVISGAELWFIGGANYEAKPSLQVRVSVDDSAVGGSVDAFTDFSLSITNVNDAPTSISLAAPLVNENQKGIAIGILSTVDEDSGDTFTYTVDDARFEVAGNTIKLKPDSAIDYESEPTILITVTATDSSGASVQRGFSLSVRDGFEATAIDGYVAGAIVFADTNENGALDEDEGEVWTTTDGFGQFTLFGGAGPLVMFGGTDISTNKPFLGIMRAPEGSTVVTPLTTLVAAILDTATEEQPISTSQANNLVLAGLGLAPGVNLATFDPIAATLSSDTGLQEQGAASIAAAIQVQNTIVQAASVLQGAGAGAVTFDSAATSFVSALAAQIAAPPPDFSLGNASAISAAITSAASNTSGVDTQKVGVVVAAATQVITESNVLVEIAAAGSSGVSLLETLAQVSSVAQDATTSLANAASTGVTTSVLADYAGDGLAGAVLAAEETIGNVAGVNGDDTVEGTEASDTLYGYGGNDTLIGFGGNDTLIGGDGDDNQIGGDRNDRLIGGVGNDILDGGAGGDRAIYTDATGGITVALAAGTVSGAGIGTDTLLSVENITGSDYADSYNATGFGPTNVANVGSSGAINGFEGMGGDDTIVGNGTTILMYTNATGGVTVDLAAGSASGDASVGTDSFSGVSGITASAFNDTLLGSNNNTGVQLFIGGAGDDLIDGRGGLDRANYASILDDNVTGGVIIDMAAGIVTGDASVGADTLRGIEFVRGSQFADVYVATGFGLVGALNIGASGTFNEFEGMGGDDTITGNGNTRIVFYNATSGVTVDLAAGTATGTSTGTDTFTGVNSVTGSQFADTLSGSDNAQGTSEQFEGRAGNDLFDGRGGHDTAVYNTDGTVDAGITVNMAAGTVTSTSAAIGTDTLQGIEAIRATNFADIYDATGFGSGSTNAGSLGTFNEFEGAGGNDTITGNGNTQISFNTATAGVTVNLAAGTAFGATIGTDTILGGVSRVRGSNSNDDLTGDEINNTLDGQSGNDIISGGGGNDNINGGAGDDTITGGEGNDTLTGGGGADTFVFEDGFGDDLITDFLQGQGDKIDLTGVTTVTDFATLQTLATQSGDETAIDFGNGNILFLDNFNVADLTEDDFLFGEAVNPAPTDLSLEVDTIAENTTINTVIGLVLAVDNPGDTLTFELVDNAGGLFAIDGNNLVVAGALDYENATSHQVTLRVTDSASNIYEDTLTVQVSDVNEAPDGISLSSVTIPENSAAGAIVGALSASDPDAAETFTFALLDNAGGRFALNGSNEIVVAGALDYESATSHQITVRVTDGASNIHEETLTVDVTNVSGSISGTPGADLGLIGTLEEDVITALGGDDILQGLAGNDFLDGGTGNDRAVYTDATGGITVNLSDGTVSGAGVGTDTLRSVESITGSNFSDLYNATGFGPASPNVPSVGILNGIEAMGGNDTIIGNGNTIVSYLNAAAGVTVDLLAGNAQGVDAGDVANVGTDTLTGVFAVVGSAFNDILRGSNTTSGLEFFNGNAGDDLIDGRGGFDRVNYSSLVLADDTVTGGVNINMASGIVIGDDASVGTDTLRGIEALRGTRFDDTYVATGFSGTSTNAGSNGTFNEFEGMDGDDTITGNGNTRIAFYNATAGVTVDLAAGIAVATSDDASIGTDDWTTTVINGFIGGINAVTGSQFDDILLGSNNPNQTVEIFEGRAGDDTINGRGGFDQVIYNTDAAVTSGIAVTVAGGNLDWIVTGSGAVGTDTLTATESIRGTNFADTFDATDFSGASTDTISLGAMGATFNEFEGMGGNDTFTGNGNTRISYVSATAGVTVDLAAGTATGNASVGTDTILGGVTRVRASNFNDVMTGSAANDTLEGQGGNDRAIFSNATGAITINLGLGTVSGTGVGSDTLRSVENITGSNFGDTYNASTFSGGSANAGSVGNINSFEGMGGDDFITGNNSTLLTYLSATGGVTADIDAGTATGDASVGTDTFTGVVGLRGSNFNDTLSGSDTTSTVESFLGEGGDDLMDGRGGLDRVNYASILDDLVTGGINIDMASGIVTGNASVGTDTLRAIEFVRGSRFADTYVATGFSGSSANSGSSGTFNEFEGVGGNDTITGNGNTRIAFYNATGGVTVDIAAGTATGDASVGSDTFTGVNSITGSQFADTLRGSDNPNGTSEQFEGRAGNDFFDGRGGFDQAVYSNDPSVTAGITINMAAGTVTGQATTVGTDTLQGIESIRGTNQNDTYNAAGFGAASANAGSLGDFNEFEGAGGNDVITGNGNTQISFNTATAGVTVDLITGTVTGDASVGTDTILGGVTRVRGSNFNDTFTGNESNNTLEGRGGSDTFVFKAGFGFDTIMDFQAGLGLADVIEFRDGIFSDFASVLAAATTSGLDTIITVDAATTLTLQNVALASLNEDDFRFF
jgi:Ca2+-binding RTX toxin-like protein